MLIVVLKMLFVVKRSMVLILSGLYF